MGAVASCCKCYPQRGTNDQSQCAYLGPVRYLDDLRLVHNLSPYTFKIKQILIRQMKYSANFQNLLAALILNFVTPLILIITINKIILKGVLHVRNHYH